MCTMKAQWKMMRARVFVVVIKKHIINNNNERHAMWGQQKRKNKLKQNENSENSMKIKIEIKMKTKIYMYIHYSSMKNQLKFHLKNSMIRLLCNWKKSSKKTVHWLDKISSLCGVSSLSPLIWYQLEIIESEMPAICWIARISTANAAVDPMVFFFIVWQHNIECENIHYSNRNWNLRIKIVAQSLICKYWHWIRFWICIMVWVRCLLSLTRLFSSHNFFGIDQFCMRNKDNKFKYYE